MIRLYRRACRQLLVDVARVLAPGRHRAAIEADSLTAHGYADYFEAALYACFEARHRSGR